MLELPHVGMARSVTKSNVQLDVLADWIEATVLFQADVEVSASDVVDVLCEDEIFSTQGLAWQAVNDAWALLRLRQQVLGVGSAVEVDAKRIRRVREWRAAPAQAFCVMLCCLRWYHKWAKQFGTDYTEQGELFERLTHLALTKLFPLWDVYQTGWSRTRVAQLRAVVDGVAKKLGEAVGDLARWTRESAKEAGLDLMLFRPFADGRTGLPVFLFQCASGADWNEKLHTPSLRIWTKVIQFPSDPKKAFATPFAILSPEFARTSNLVDGLVIDRLRLLSPAAVDPGWVPADFAQSLIDWLEPRVNALPFKQ
jgi:hypothetical protein